MFALKSSVETLNAINYLGKSKKIINQYQIMNGKNILITSEHHTTLVYQIT